MKLLDRWSVVAIGAVVALAMTSASCSSSGDGGSAPEASAVATTAPPAPTQAELEDALLTVGDMPVGFSVSDELADSMTEDDSGGSGGGPGGSGSDFICPQAGGGPSDDVAPGAQASAGFAQGQFGPFVAELVGHFGADADEVFADARAAFEGCTGQSWEETDDDGEVVTYRLAEMSFPALGDESAAYRLSGSMEGGAMEGDLVVVRAGETVVILVGLGVTTPVGDFPLPADVFASVASTAIDKIKAV